MKLILKSIFCAVSITAFALVSNVALAVSLVHQTRYLSSKGVGVEIFNRGEDDDIAPELLDDFGGDAEKRDSPDTQINITDRCVGC